VQTHIYWAALVFPSALAFFYTLGLALAALLVVLARDGRYQFHEHRIDCTEHPTRELVAPSISRTLVAGGQIKRDDAQALEVDIGLELLPGCPPAGVKYGRWIRRSVHHPARFPDQPR
jgi:hypothetical protein